MSYFNIHILTLTDFYKYNNTVTYDNLMVMAARSYVVMNSSLANFRKSFTWFCSEYYRNCGHIQGLDLHWLACGLVPVDQFKPSISRHEYLHQQRATADSLSNTV